MNDNVNLPDCSEGNQPSEISAIYQSFAAVNELLNAGQQIVDLATHLTGAENCSLMILNGHDELYILNSFGLAAANLKSTQIKLGEGIAGLVAANGNPLFVEDISNDPHLSVYRRERYRTGSFIACPITASERVIGVLNVTDKKSGEPFNQDDFNQVKKISTLAAVALSSFQGKRNFTFRNGTIDEIYRRLVEAEVNNREFFARITCGMQIPLHNIKGAVYSLKSSVDSGKTKELEFYDIIEKEVDYLITYLDEGIRSYENVLRQLENLEEREKYRKLLE